jgi:hypothetical protein
MKNDMDMDMDMDMERGHWNMDIKNGRQNVDAGEKSSPALILLPLVHHISLVLAFRRRGRSGIAISRTSPLAPSYGNGKHILKTSEKLQKLIKSLRSL